MPRTGSPTSPTWAGCWPAGSSCAAGSVAATAESSIPASAARRPLRCRKSDLIRRWEAIPRERLHEVNREELDLLLRKAGKLGVHGLSSDERAFLERMANSFQG